jgi:hypothetical protein
LYAGEEVNDFGGIACEMNVLIYMLNHGRMIFYVGRRDVEEHCREFVRLFTMQKVAGLIRR